MRAARDSWVNPALALLLCTSAGALCTWLGIPLPWMIGPLLAMAACNFAGAELRAPPGGRAAGQMIIGTALGLYFTPSVGREVLAHWPVLVVAAVVAMFLGALGGLILRRASGVDATTAFFASVPGGATEMTLLGERFHARADRVALAQSLRILVVVIVAIALAAGLAAALAFAAGLPVASLVLALAPGGIAEMCITAKVLQLGVPLVTAAHVTRVIVLILATGPGFQAARSLRARVRRA